MRHPLPTYCALAAAVSVWIGGASMAPAQYRIGNDGRALDASNQVGTNGYNTDHGPNSNYNSNVVRNQVSANQIISNNVTGGRGFRGFSPIRDPYSLRSFQPSNSIDRFVQNTYGAPAPYTAGRYNQNWNPQAYYGQTQLAAVPPGYARSTDGGYVPFTPKTATRQPGDLRLGAPMGVPVGTLPGMGTTTTAGPVDPSADANSPPSQLYASPLYGLRIDEGALGAGSIETSQFGSSSLYSRSTNGFTPGRSRLDDSSLRRMRDELRNNVVPDNQAIGAPANADQQQPVNPNDTNGAAPGGAAPAPPAGAVPAGKAVAGSALPSPALASNALAAGNLNAGAQAPGANDFSTDQSLRRNLVISAAAQQSPQYMEMRKRLDAFNKAHPNLTDADAQRQFQQQVETQNKIAAANAEKNKPAGATPAAPGAPGTPTATGTPSVTGTPGGVQASKTPAPAGTVTPQPKPAPVMVHTLAEGVKAKGLADLLTNAEDLMRQGKFSSAMDRYAEAGEVDPNNPLVWMGQANAELGASSYARAESHLREAFSTDPSLLMAQYDLKGFFGPDRLNFLVKDLKEIATAEQDQPRPVFLLAYISYNTGEERKAGAYLDLAEKRSGGKDPILGLLREHWTIPPKDAAKPGGNLLEQNK